MAVKEEVEGTETNESVKEKIDAVQSIVQGCFPHLWHAVDLGLATCATLLLEDNVNPVAVIYVGPPSAGKSTVAEMFVDAEVNGEILCYVSDDFTPAAFVSHAANISEEDLGKNDLLPRIRHKVLVTPELATIFRGNHDELVKKFATLTRVLDGKGLQRDTGHGSRGYRGDYLFAWLGCTTPFEQIVWKIMGQLGSRLFFQVINREEEFSIEELINPKDTKPYSEKLEECKVVVHKTLESLFNQYGGVRGVEWEQRPTELPFRRWIGQCSLLLAKMRSKPAKEIKGNNGSSECTPAVDEAPFRAYAVLCNLARGHALVHGRTWLEWEDLPLIARVTVSTMPPHLGQVFQEMVFKGNGMLTSAEVQNVLKVKSPDTAKTVMKYFDQLGVMEYTQSGQGKTSYLQFPQKWEWCGSEEFRALLIE